MRPSPESAKPENRSRGRMLTVAGYLVAILVLAFYFVQNSRMAPNHTDGGLILTYVDDLARGLRPHWDFIDAYGPLNWPMPVLFYTLAGHKVWGIRIWMIVLKIIIVLLTFKLVRRLSGVLYAALASIWMALLYGQAWQSLQTAYGFNNVVPFVLGAWYFLLCGPFKRKAINVSIAGVLTAAAVWVKVNAGLFLLAGGLFYCFYWLPATDLDRSPRDARFGKLFRLAQIVGACVYAVVFYGYVSQYFDAWYFVYLVGPLLIALGWTLYQMSLRREETPPVMHHLKAWGLYFAVTIAFGTLVLFGLTGISGVGQYVREQADIFTNLDYMLPFSELGVPDEYIGFNENYWPQVPWLFSLVFLAWLFLQYRGRGEQAFGAAWEVTRARGFGVFMMATLYLFVMYSRADETHVFQAMVIVPPALFILLHQIEALCLRSARKRSLAFRGATAFVALAWGSTIAIEPGLEVFDLSTAQRDHPKLEYLRYRELYNPYVRDYSADISDHEWDRMVDKAAEYIDSITEDGEVILVLDANRLIHILSDTRPVGGRYHFYFYMLSTKLFQRPGFDRAVPDFVLQRILDNPPRVIVGAIERLPPLAVQFPEFRRLIAEHYEVTKQYRHILIYEPKDPKRRVQAPQG